LAKPLPNNITPQTFWQHIEPYFAPITKEEIGKHLSVKADKSTQKAFTIPPLGDGDDGGGGGGSSSSSKRRKTKARGGAAGAKSVDEESELLHQTPAEQWKKSEIIHPGELTARVLQAMIEPPVAARSLQAAAAAAEEKGESSGKSSDLAPSWPLAVSPVSHYSPRTMATLEERLQTELRSVGLLDDHGLLPAIRHRQDDQVCAELRALQRGLRERIRINNQRRTQILQLVQPRLAQQQAHHKSLAENETFEKGFLARMRGRKKTKQRKGVKRKAE